MEILPLGTNGFFPSFNRHTACYALRFKDRLILLDGGSGLFRLAEPEGQKYLKGIKKVDLFLSHYHLDHTSGFYSAFKLLFGIAVNVYGVDEFKVFKDLTDKPYFPVDYDSVYANFNWQRLQPEQKIAGYYVKTRKQYHRGSGSMAFRFEFGKDRSFAYITDSEPDENSINFAKNVQILLHEWEFDKNSKIFKESNLESYFNDGHVTTIGASLTAKGANVKRLYLIHHNPFADFRTIENQVLTAKQVFPETFAAYDLSPIAID
jgi:ribonuclease BN (tRNA processing enzyme)